MIAARIINARAPLYPQLVPSIPLWTNGRQTIQSYQRPGPDWFRIAIKCKEAA